jgi:hypothetical protein
MLDKYINGCTLAMYRTLTYYYGRIKSYQLRRVALLITGFFLFVQSCNSY